MYKIAVISGQVSPISGSGIHGGNGQAIDINLENTVTRLASQGCLVDVFTRCNHLLSPRVLHWKKHIRVIHVPAGPSATMPIEAWLPYMAEFGQYLLRFFRNQKRGYDVMHVDSYIPGLAAIQVKRELDIPLILCLPNLSRPQLYPETGAKNTELVTDVRFEIEQALIDAADRIRVQCPQARRDLQSFYHADPLRIEGAANIDCHSALECGFGQVGTDFRGTYERAIGADFQLQRDWFETKPEMSMVVSEPLAKRMCAMA